MQAEVETMLEFHSAQQYCLNRLSFGIFEPLGQPIRIID
jgi:hypothetical protein